MGVCGECERNLDEDAFTHTPNVFNNQHSLIIPCQQLRGLFVCPPPPTQTHILPPSITTRRLLPSLLPLPVCGFVTFEARAAIEPAFQHDYSRARRRGVLRRQRDLKSRLGQRGERSTEGRRGKNSLWMLISRPQSLWSRVVMLAQLGCNHVRLAD